MSDSLYERIGGEAATEAAVELLYRKMLADDSISRFFASTNMVDHHAKQKAFLTMAFGGPNQYTGKDLRTVHGPLVAQGLNAAHFSAVAGHLQATLQELGVAQELAEQVMAIAASTRDDVLNL